MKINELQAEINHLLFLYYTSIGVLQRDAMSEDVNIYDSIGALIDEILACFKRIETYFETSIAPVEYPSDYFQVIEDGKEYVKDGLAFIEKIIDH